MTDSRPLMVMPETETLKRLRELKDRRTENGIMRRFRQPETASPDSQRAPRRQPEKRVCNK